ncbi:MAG: LON peptidase substrate-binding domain-containing protein [Pseudomonadota bacterium]
MPEELTLFSLPLFPLGTVLYPGGTLPLRIFEVRYLDMIGKCHKTDAPFGIVSLNHGSEVRKIDSKPGSDGFVQEEFNTVGTLATITNFSASQPGLISICCKGDQRFRISNKEKLRHGLWIAEVTRVDDDAEIRIPDDLKPIANALGKLISTLEQRDVEAGHQMPVARPYRLNDCGWVANRWCELLPIPTELKQRLMELENPLLRLELAGDILERTGIAL